MMNLLVFLAFVGAVYGQIIGTSDGTPIWSLTEQATRCTDARIPDSDLPPLSFVTGTQSNKVWSPSGWTPSSTPSSTITTPPYIRPTANDQPGCDIYGPLCQTGSISVGVRAPNATGTNAISTTTMACSSYLSAQLSSIPDYPWFDDDEWMYTFGRTEQCKAMARGNDDYLFEKCGNASFAMKHKRNFWPRGVETPTDVCNENGTTKNCCGPCQMTIREIKVFYFPSANPWTNCTIGNSTDTNSTLPAPSSAANGSWNSTKSSGQGANGAGSLGTIIQSIPSIPINLKHAPVVSLAPGITARAEGLPAASTVVIDDYTYTSPSFYLHISGNLYPSDGCGAVDPVLTNPIIPVNPTDMFTISAELDRGATWVENTQNFPVHTKPFNVDEAACPTWGLSDRSSYQIFNPINGMSDQIFYYTVGPPYNPVIVPPGAIRSATTAWSKSCMSFPPNDNYPYIFDPPSALVPQTGLIPNPGHMPTTTSHTEPVTTSAPAPVDTAPAFAPTTAVHTPPNHSPLPASTPDSPAPSPETSQLNGPNRPVTPTRLPEPSTGDAQLPAPNPASSSSSGPSRAEPPVSSPAPQGPPATTPDIGGIISSGFATQNPPPQNTAAPPASSVPSPNPQAASPQPTSPKHTNPQAVQPPSDNSPSIPNLGSIIASGFGITSQAPTPTANAPRPSDPNSGLAPSNQPAPAQQTPNIPQPVPASPNAPAAQPNAPAAAQPDVPVVQPNAPVAQPDGPPATQPNVPDSVPNTSPGQASVIVQPDAQTTPHSSPEQGGPPDSPSIDQDSSSSVAVSPMPATSDTPVTMPLVPSMATTTASPEGEFPTGGVAIPPSGIAVGGDAPSQAPQDPTDENPVVVTFTQGTQPVTLAIPKSLSNDITRITAGAPLPTQGGIVQSIAPDGSLVVVPQPSNDAPETQSQASAAPSDNIQITVTNSGQAITLQVPSSLSKQISRITEGAPLPTQGGVVQSIGSDGSLVVAPQIPSQVVELPPAPAVGNVRFTLTEGGHPVTLDVPTSLSSEITRITAGARLPTKGGVIQSIASDGDIVFATASSVAAPVSDDVVVTITASDRLLTLDIPKSLSNDISRITSGAPVPTAGGRVLSIAPDGSLIISSMSELTGLLPSVPAAQPGVAASKPDVLVVGSTSITLSPSGASTQTIGDQVLTAQSGKVMIGSSTLTAGGPAVTIDGQKVSLLAGNDTAMPTDDSSPSGPGTAAPTVSGGGGGGGSGSGGPLASPVGTGASSAASSTVASWSWCCTALLLVGFVLI